ncbi:hypothetical protein RHGRI_034248 [Rhododendron griersonianum]|uniref:Uncharacterized protein n=1 Tax=Rhododendron griersonianum TaxID=479676 RepID=A0AAV6HZX4_9ERIC|nr:hypothetical protein RHGRI_034248 [Rhododendron griersonianum]
MSTPRDHSASSSQHNVVSTVVSSIVSTLPPKPSIGPTLGDNINEDVDGEEDKDGGNDSNEFASVLDDMDVDSSQSCVTMVED